MPVPLRGTKIDNLRRIGKCFWTSVQAQVLNLLNELKETFLRFTYLFISHDLAVSKVYGRSIDCNEQGPIEELGDADEIYENPKQPITAFN